MSETIAERRAASREQECAVYRELIEKVVADGLTPERETQLAELADRLGIAPATVTEHISWARQIHFVAVSGAKFVAKRESVEWKTAVANLEKHVAGFAPILKKHTDRLAELQYAVDSQCGDILEYNQNRADADKMRGNLDLSIRMNVW